MQKVLRDLLTKTGVLAAGHRHVRDACWTEYVGHRYQRDAVAVTRRVERYWSGGCRWEAHHAAGWVVAAKGANRAQVARACKRGAAAPALFAFPRQQDGRTGIVKGGWLLRLQRLRRAEVQE